MTDASGYVVGRIDYDPYGEASVTVEPGKTASGNPYLFQGRRWDDEVDLYYFRNRLMSPVLGRFLQRDPSELLSCWEGRCEAGRSGWATYLFGGGDSVNWIDPFGLERLTATYDMQRRGDVAWYERLMEPGGTKWTPTTRDVLRDIQSRIRWYDPAGRQGDCFEYVTFTGHSGVPGVIPLGDVVFSVDVIDNLRRMNECRKKQGKPPLDFPLPERTFLEELSHYLCSDTATVRFVYCSSGAGQKRKRLRAWIEHALNGRIKVVQYDTDVKWSWGRVRKVMPAKSTKK